MAIDYLESMCSMQEPQVLITSCGGNACKISIEDTPFYYSFCILLKLLVFVAFYGHLFSMGLNCGISLLLLY